MLKIPRFLQRFHFSSQDIPISLDSSTPNQHYYFTYFLFLHRISPSFLKYLLNSQKFKNLGRLKIQSLALGNNHISQSPPLSLSLSLRMGEKKSSGGWCGWFLAFIVLAAVALAVFFTVRSKMHNSDSGPAPVPGPPGAIAKKYADALKVATQFLDIQKCTFSPFFPFIFSSHSAFNICDQISCLCLFR